MKILFDRELIINERARGVIVQHPRQAKTCCLHLLFPHLRDLHIDRVEDREGPVLITARASAADAACHRCGISAARV